MIIIINPINKTEDNKTYPVFIKITYKNGKLSLSGVEGPRLNGNAWGSSGQIDTHLKIEDRKNWTYQEGWSDSKMNKLLDIWDKWHLNDMNPACEHQEALGWGNKKLKIAKLKLDYEKAGKKQNEIEKKVLEQIKKTGTSSITEEERILLALPYFLSVPEEKIPEYPLYKVDSTEEKTSGWVYEKDHPEGVLSKPCPTCGYKYGTAWKKREVPQDVIDWLFNLPETKIQPAWV